MGYFIRECDHKVIKGKMTLNIEGTLYKVLDWDSTHIRVRGPSGKVYRWDAAACGCKLV